MKHISSISMGWDKHGTAGTYHRVRKYTTANDFPFRWDVANGDVAPRFRVRNMGGEEEVSLPYLGSL